MSTFTDKVAIITGGGTGIGLAVARRFVTGGAKVVITGRREEPLKVAASELGEAVRYISADVSRSGASKDIVAFALKQFGRIDILVNNAGYGLIGPLATTSDEELDQVLAVNVKGVLAMTRDALAELEKNRGSVINISSVGGQATFPGAAAYSGTKAAVDRVTRSLAVELGPQGIRVNVVSPGATETAMYDQAIGIESDASQQTIAQTPLQRLGTPDDIAKAVVWLASDDAAWVTGQIVQSSGGFML